ncbi:MAG: hypothetical protein WC725_04845 [Patescibacteria group bacterium]|jgi:hypothetical protein
MYSKINPFEYYKNDITHNDLLIALDNQIKSVYPEMYNNLHWGFECKYGEERFQIVSHNAFYIAAPYPGDNEGLIIGIYQDFGNQAQRIGCAKILDTGYDGKKFVCKLSGIINQWFLQNAIYN